MRPEDEKRGVAGQENEAQAAENAAESTAAETSAEESADERAFEEGIAEADETASAPESEEAKVLGVTPDRRVWKGEGENEGNRRAFAGTAEAAGGEDRCGAGYGHV